MKKRIRKTGEIVDVIYYVCYSNERTKYDEIHYIDSKGDEIHSNLHYHWDLEDINEEYKITINWEQRKYEMTKDFTVTLLGRLNYDPFMPNACCCCSDDKPVNPYSNIVAIAVSVADALIEELKKGV